MPRQTLFTGTAARSMHIFLDPLLLNFLPAAGWWSPLVDPWPLLSVCPCSSHSLPGQYNPQITRRLRDPRHRSRSPESGEETTTPGSCFLLMDESLSRRWSGPGPFIAEAVATRGKGSGWVGQGRCACDPGAFRSWGVGAALSSDLDARAARVGRCPRRPRPRCRCPRLARASARVPSGSWRLASGLPPR